MGRFQTLAVKLGIIGGTLLMAALASVGYTLWASWQLEGGAAAVNEAGRMRMQTWRLAQTLARGDAVLAKTQIDQFEQSVALLRDGDPSRPLLVSRDTRSAAAFADVQRTPGTQYGRRGPPRPRLTRCRLRNRLRPSSDTLTSSSRRPKCASPI